MSEGTERIFDSVYGYIDFSKEEFALTTTPLFQRLQRIKQLGPINQIFPSAQHSRFSHSIGVFHIIKKMIKHLNFPKEQIEDKYAQELKFAALLHDIGHIPLSHTGEIALEHVYNEQPFPKGKDVELISKKARLSWQELFNDKFKGSDSKLHENLSAELVLYHKEIAKVLDPLQDKGKLNKENVAKLIVGKHENPILNSLLHSELDADRLDYLLRDSYFTGVGYGSVDLDYLISKLRIFEEELPNTYPTVCVDDRGIHTLEHYLLARFFFHTQVVMNEKSTFLDSLFLDVMKYMIKNDSAKWNLPNLNNIVDEIHLSEKEGNKSHELYNLTDDIVFTKMRDLHEELDRKERKPEEDYINDCIKTIMDSQVPDVLATARQLISLERKEKNHQREGYKSKKREIKSKADELKEKLVTKLGFFKDRLIVSVNKRGILKYTEIKDSKERKDIEANREAVQIYINNQKNNDEPIKYAALSNASLLRNLIDKELLVLNVFFIDPEGRYKKEVEEVKKEFQKFVQDNFSDELN